MRRLIIYTFILSLLFCSVQAVCAAEPKLVWSKDIKHELFEVAPDGSFYVSNGRLIARYGNDGALKWELTTRGPVKDMAVSKDGSVVIVSSKALTMISIDGEIEWTSEANDEIITVEALPSGLIVVGHAYGVQAFDATGATLWDHYPHEECDY